MRIKLTKKAECRKLTLPGWICLFFILFWISVGYIKGVHPFLALNKPVNARILIVDGQFPGYGYDSIVKIIAKDHYEVVVTAGVDMDYTYISDENFNIAAWSYKVLSKKNIENCRLEKVPAGRAKRDRTYTSAVAVKNWMISNKINGDMNIVAFDVHARRSYILYKKAFKKHARVGVIALKDLSYDSKRWYNDSRGVRQVMSETIGYIYAGLFFHPAKQINKKMNH